MLVPYISTARYQFSTFCRQCSYTNRRWMGEALAYLRHEAKPVEIDQVRHCLEIVTKLLSRYSPPPVVITNTLATTSISVVRIAVQNIFSNAALCSSRTCGSQSFSELFVDACSAECGARSPVYVDSSGA